jgi:hypothetical protein
MILINIYQRVVQVTYIKSHINVSSNPLAMSYKISHEVYLSLYYLNEVFHKNTSAIYDISAELHS